MCPSYSTSQRHLVPLSLRLGTLTTFHGRNNLKHIAMHRSAMQLVACSTVSSFEKISAKINKSRLDEYLLLAPSCMSRFGILGLPSGSQKATVRSTQAVFYSIALFKTPWHHWHCHEDSSSSNHQAALAPAWHIDSNLHSVNGRTNCISICVAFRVPCAFLE